MNPIERTIQFQQLQHSVEFMPGTILGAYCILRKIGAGGMGAVYEVEHVMLRQRFALKTLFVQGDTEEERQDCIDRFLQEARITSQLHHPGIVSVQTLEQDKKTGALYFVMDYVSMSRRRRQDLLHSAFADATAWHRDTPLEDSSVRTTLSLEDLYQHGKRIDRCMNPDLVRRLIMDVAQALHYAHNLGDGIIHRDIKPANILIQENGHAVLADFGVAKIADAILRKSVLRGNDRSLSLRMEVGGESYHIVLGTVDYMAPELRSGSPPSPQTDLYALGATLYQLLTGELPSGNTPPPSSYGLNPLWDEIVKRCLAVNADERYPTLMDFNLALASFPRVIRIRKLRRRALWTLGVAACAFLVALPSILSLNTSESQLAPRMKGIRIPRPTPTTAFQFIEYSHSVTLQSAHPDLCGYVEVPASINDKPVTEIAPDAFQSCTQVSGVYLPTGISTANTGLIPLEKAFFCPEPDCLACKLRRSILAQVPPNTRPYAWGTVLKRAQAATVRPEETFSIGATVVHENISYSLDETGWVATSISGPAPKHLTFPDSIGNAILYKIGDHFCHKQKRLRRVTFPRHLREIGERAFAESGLSGVIHFPESLVAIRTAAFMGASNIDQFVLPPKLERIEHSAFQDTRKQAAISLPETLDHYGPFALCGTHLQQIRFKLPNCVTQAHPSYFQNHGGAIQTFEIPSISNFPAKTLSLLGTGGSELTLQMDASNVTIATHAIQFYHNRHKQLTLQFKEGAQVTLEKDFITDCVQPFIPMEKLHGKHYRLAVRIGDKESVWDGGRFVGNADFIYDGKRMTDVATHPYTIKGETFVRLHDTTCTHFTVPDGITRIQSGAFIGSRCESLTLPESVTHLETGSFKGMKKLKTITLPASINWRASQYDWLFDLCFELERIIINSPLPTWRLGMFSKCRKLKYIVLAGTQSVEPTFTAIPMWDEEKLCKPIHVILVTQQDTEVKNAPPQDVRVLKLQLDRKGYVPVETDTTQSIEAIGRAYEALAVRSDFISYLASMSDTKFQVTAPAIPPLMPPAPVARSTNEIPSETSPSDENVLRNPLPDNVKQVDDFIVQENDNELIIFKCLKTQGRVALPPASPEQRVVVEADAFANCTLLVLEVLGTNVVFKKYAFRDASIKKILFFGKTPIFSAPAFSGVKGDFPECLIYMDGRYTPALITFKSMRLLCQTPFLNDFSSPFERKFYLFDYISVNEKRIFIPSSIKISYEHKKCDLYLLPGCLKNCRDVEHIVLNSSNWISPEAFMDIPSLKKITLPNRLNKTAQELRYDLLEYYKENPIEVLPLPM